MNLTEANKEINRALGQAKDTLSLAPLILSSRLHPEYYSLLVKDKKVFGHFIVAIYKSIPWLPRKILPNINAPKYFTAWLLLLDREMEREKAEANRTEVIVEEIDFSS